jgi:amino acid permease
LIINNISGPAMMSFPHLFHQAGIAPVILCIIWVLICSSLTATMFADAIASIPGNARFTRNINFSEAFRLLVGHDWYVVSETLFLLSCMVQICASLVETAQSLDGFLASFLVGKTYALQFWPTLTFIEWTPALCHEVTNVD